MHPYNHYTGQVAPARLAPDLGSQGHLWSDNDVITSWLRLISTSDLHASLLCIYKVFELLVCGLKGVLVHPYSVTPAKLAPDLGIQVHLRSENDAITSCFGLISTQTPSYTLDISLYRPGLWTIFRPKFASKINGYLCFSQCFSYY
jgi:hypothetical protein